MVIVRQIIASAIAFLLAAIIVAMVQAYMPAIEGRFFPVAQVTSYTIQRAEEGGDTLIYGTQKKVRDCSILSIDVAVVDPLGVSSEIRRKRSDQVIVRDTGEFDWGPWSLEAPLDVIEQWLRVTTVHRCHPFWLTKSVYLDVQQPGRFQPS